MRTITLLVALFSLSCSAAHSVAPSDLDDIREAVFRYQVQQLPRGHDEEAEIYFFSLEQDSDPPEDFLARFADLPLSVRPLSAAERVFRDGTMAFDWREKETGRKGESYRIQSVKIHGPTTAEVEGSFGFAGYLFEVRKLGRKWRVLRSTMTSIA